MKLKILIVLILFSSTVFSQTKKILFIGNSYTNVNNLPQLLHDVAFSKGDTVAVYSSTPGGYTFQLHSAYAPTLALIDSMNWDVVVLQEQSQLPSFSPSQVASAVYPYAQQLDNLIKQNDSCTRTLFYMTWGRKFGDASNCGGYPPVCTYAGMQERLRTSYLQMGKTNGAIVAPCGIAWKNSIAADSSLNLYMSDNSHPSIEGSYLNACVFYATIFKKSPVGASFISSLSAATASYLQTIAAQTVLDSLSTWNNDVYIPDPHFSFNQQSNAVSFININSAHYTTHYKWLFGDGDSSSAKNPTHTYLSNGYYPTTCIAYTSCLSDNFVDTVYITTASINPTENSSLSFQIFPNPVDDFIEYKGLGKNKNVCLEITNVSGRVFMIDALQTTNDKLIFNASSLSKGIYFCRLKSGNYFSSMKKFVKN